MKTVFQKIPALLVILTVLPAVSLPARAAGEYPVEDTSAGAGAGTEEHAEGTPRIVQIGSAAFIVQNALYLFPEAHDSVIAIADGNQGNGLFLGDLDPDINAREILPRAANTETVLALAPDTVVLKNFLKTRMGEPLEKLGVETVYLNLETPEAWENDLEVLGTLFGNQERAEVLKSLFAERISEVENQLAGLSDGDRPRTLFLYWSVKDGVSAVNVPPPGWMQTRVVEMAGGAPVWTDTEMPERWTRVNIEQIAAWNPEHIVLAAYHIPTDTAMDAILSDPLWAELTAVKEGNIHAFPADYHSWDQPDARWVLGLTWLAGELHPSLFPELDIETEAREFYRDFFLMDDEAFDRMIAPRLTW